MTVATEVAPESTLDTLVRIDGKRLWDSLMTMAKIGATPKGGARSRSCPGRSSR